MDGKGYTVPYDDIKPSNGANQSRSICDGSPGLFTITVEEIDGLVSWRKVLEKGAQEGSPIDQVVVAIPNRLFSNDQARTILESLIFPL